MRKTFLAMFIVTILLLMFTGTSTLAKTKHTIKSGETLWTVSQKYGVPLASLQKVNHKYTDELHVGETLTIPHIVTESEKDLLARLVRAEAQGESYAGKVAIATVVLNRVDSSLFPNTVRDVIYEVSPGGVYAFSPVENGEINKPADYASKKAVVEALAFRGQGRGSLYFYNPDKTDNKWIRSRQVTTVIGNHVFAK